MANGLKSKRFTTNVISVGPYLWDKQTVIAGKSVGRYSIFRSFVLLPKIESSKVMVPFGSPIPFHWNGKSIWMGVCFNNSKFSIQMVFWNECLFQQFSFSIQMVHQSHQLFEWIFVSWTRMEGERCFWMVHSNTPILIITHSTFFSIQMSSIPIITHSTISIQIHTFK